MSFGQPSECLEMSSQSSMGWIENHLQNSTEQQPRTGAPGEFAREARQRWQKLGDELRQDVAEFNVHDSGADFSQPSDHEYVVSNSVSGLRITITADFDAQTVSYHYTTVNDRSAGVPEGGILSMRQSKRKSVEFYSSDERLTSEETREVLLQPVLFPPELAA